MALLVACLTDDSPGDVTFDDVDLHTCIDPPSSVYRTASGQILVGCSQSAGITLVEPPTPMDDDLPLPIPGTPLGPVAFHAQHIHRAHDGVVYLSGYSEVDGTRVAKVHSWGDNGFDVLLDGSNLQGMEQIIGFARQPNGIDLAIGGEQTFAYRENGEDWQVSTPDSDTGAFSGTGADVIEHNGRLVALGRAAGLSTLLNQVDQGPHFFPARLPDPGLSLTSLSSDGTHLAVGFNDRSLGTAGALVTTDPTDPNLWLRLVVDDPNAQIHAVCQFEGRTIAVGTLDDSDGFVTDFSPSELYSETTWLQQPAYACHLDEQGFVLAGGNGYLFSQ